MYKLISLLVIIFLVSCKTTTYYIVRHAEKETTNTMTSDVPLSEAGRQRAQALKDLLQNEHIKTIYSTNFIRTRSTAQPLSDALHIPIQTYEVRDTGFVRTIKNTTTGNMLIVGHSNTVDDLVNGLMGSKEVQGDLPDSEYGDLFVVKRKGKKYSFVKKHFGL
jgi:2,3-bisphosphoglycerate-dependent phosphoglycerate mutase